MTAKVRKRTNVGEQQNDEFTKQQKPASSQEKGVNPLLILLLVCVILTWGIAATVVFNLVDYRGLAGWAQNKPEKLGQTLEPVPEVAVLEVDAVSTDWGGVKVKFNRVPGEPVNLRIRRQRKFNNGATLATADVTGLMDTYLLDVTIYEDLTYELLWQVGSHTTIRKFTVKLPEAKLAPDGAESLINEANKLIQDGNRFNSLEKKVEDVEALGRKHPEVALIRWIGAQGTDTLAEQRRSNKFLLTAIKKMIAIGDDQSANLHVRKAALVRAHERSTFLGRNTLALQIAEKLVNLEPKRNYEALKKLVVAYLMIGKNVEAAQSAQKMLDIDEMDGWANVHTGFAVKALNTLQAYEDCLIYFKRGIESEEAETDDPKYRYHWGDALVRLDRKTEANNMFEVAAQKGVFLSKFQRSTYNIDHLKGQPWWTPDELGLTIKNYIRKFEIEWQTIRDEALELMDENDNFPNFDKESEGLQKEGDWRQFNLWQRGMEEERNCKLVPKTCHMIRAMTEATNCRRGQIKFSVMKPGTVVWPHTGPTNCRLRLHLGLKVPEDHQNVNLTVAEETKYWEEGKVLVFDDSFEHSVMHHGESYRLVLIFDVWHPGLSKKEKNSLTSI